MLDAEDFARAEHEFLGTAEERLHQLLLDVVARLPARVEDLYAWLLERTEEIAGAIWARAFANLIAVTRSDCARWIFARCCPP